MAKFTSKLPITVPRTPATRLEPRPADDIARTEGARGLRGTSSTNRRLALDRESRLCRFDEATERQQRRQQNIDCTSAERDRGWSRGELYGRRRVC